MLVLNVAEICVAWGRATVCPIHFLCIIRGNTSLPCALSIYCCYKCTLHIFYVQGLPAYPLHFLCLGTASLACIRWIWELPVHPVHFLYIRATSQLCMSIGIVLRHSNYEALSFHSKLFYKAGSSQQKYIAKTKMKNKGYYQISKWEFAGMGVSRDGRNDERFHTAKVYFNNSTSILYFTLMCIVSLSKYRLCHRIGICP